MAARLRARADQARPATCCRCSAGTPRPPDQRWRSREVEDAARQAVPGAGRLAGRLPPAARLAAACRRRPPIPTSCRVDPLGAARPTCPTPEALLHDARAAAPHGAAGLRSPPTPTSQQDRVEQELGEIGGAVRTASRSKSRDGRLCVFMPPVEALEDYLELVAAAEARRRGDRPAGAHRRLCAAARPAPQRHPRHARSRRHRGQHPPGRELATNASRSPRPSTRRRASRRLGADKFMIDGRHTGTGGGNHVVVGGATPADSPFLRRPDLLKSLVLYWQRHPSLSYLFSGLFIGPTSQAPRIDEARHDSLYELEIALAQVPPPGQGRRAPALAGRPAVPQPAGRRHRQHAPLRNLHRQALLARRPDRPARPGRVPRLRDAAGRAHEPGPAAAAPRADRPVLEARRRTAGFVRWGTALHDRFMLPHFVWEDFLDVLGDLAPARLRPASRNGSRRSSSSASRSAARSSTRASSWRSARRWSPGTCMGETGRHRRHGALRRFIGRTAAGQGSKAPIPTATSSPATAGACRCADRDGAASRSPACASRPGSRPPACTRVLPGQRAADLRHLRPLDAAARSAAASITSPIPAGATTRPSRSTATRPRRGAWPASSRRAHAGRLRAAGRRAVRRVPADAGPAAAARALLTRPNWRRRNPLQQDCRR